MLPEGSDEGKISHKRLPCHRIPTGQIHLGNVDMAVAGLVASTIPNPARPRGFRGRFSSEL